MNSKASIASKSLRTPRKNATKAHAGQNADEQENNDPNAVSSQDTCVVFPQNVSLDKRLNGQRRQRRWTVLARLQI
jgi:hypothetical protein